MACLVSKSSALVGWVLVVVVAVAAAAGVLVIVVVDVVLLPAPRVCCLGSISVLCELIMDDELFNADAVLATVEPAEPADEDDELMLSLRLMEADDETIIFLRFDVSVSDDTNDEANDDEEPADWDDEWLVSADCVEATDNELSDNC